MLEIRIASETDLELFFQYLDVQLQHNGANGTPIFQPLAREESRVSDALKNKFLSGVNKTVSEEGWRILMLALSGEQFPGQDIPGQKIVGHIDIRPHPNKYASHRALLGMGVDVLHRRAGIGERLLNFLLDWMQANTQFEYLDLQVMSDNLPAISLYRKLGFITYGEIGDMYRIDGKSVSETLMSRRVKN